jgi:hypothetical protein
MDRRVWRQDGHCPLAILTRTAHQIPTSSPQHPSQVSDPGALACTEKPPAPAHLAVQALTPTRNDIPNLIVPYRKRPAMIGGIHFARIGPPVLPGSQTWASV